MIIIPAIDLKGGQCVRLSQGEMGRATVYSDDPAKVAKRWQSMGAQRLHIVDLDGAVSGEPKNREAVKSIRACVSMQIELGGGIRSISTIEEYLSAGVDYIILGTAAIKNPGLLEESCKKFAGKIIIGIDARGGMLSVQGWTENTEIRAVDFAQQLDRSAVAAIVFTDINRDGMLTGPNIESTAQLAQAVTIPVIASGGVSCMEDIEKLLEIEPLGVRGVITGRALYTGDIDLKKCIELAEKVKKQESEEKQQSGAKF
jgi:phosphoribosylformimino-5-aminoimidazole carboxamide ribotide isomerase